MSQNVLPKNKKPGRLRRGVKTPFGRRNAFFQAAKKASRKGDKVSAEAAKAEMAKIQPLTQRELNQIG
jgi:hypothetical protein